MSTATAFDTAPAPRARTRADVQLTQAVSVLMPVCNEVDVIDVVLREWMDDVMVHLPEGSELVFDDCSTDGTTEKLELWRERHPFIRINRSERDGFFNS